MAVKRHRFRQHITQDPWDPRSKTHTVIRVWLLIRHLNPFATRCPASLPGSSGSHYSMPGGFIRQVVSSSKQRSDISVDKDRITEVIGSDRIIDAAASQVFSSSTATLPIPPARKRGEDEAISPGSEADFIFPPRPPSGKPLLDAYAEGIVT